MGQFFGGGHSPERGADFLNGGLPAYSVYKCADGNWLSIGSLEAWFWSETCKALACVEYTPHQLNRENYPARFASLIDQFR